MLRRSLVLSFLLVTLGLSGCANMYPGNWYHYGYYDDHAIAAAVKHRLMEDKYIRGEPVVVSSLNGNVTLSGAVDNNRQRMRAVEMAQQVVGVRSVTDELGLETR